MTRVAFCGALTALFALPVSLFAQNNHQVALNTTPPATNTTPAPELEPTVLQAMKVMSHQLRTATSFSFAATIMREEPGTNGQMLDFVRHISVEVQRPNKMRLEVNSGTSVVNFWYDGQNVTIMPAAATMYTVIPAPAGIDATLEMLKQKLDAHTPLRPFLSNDPYAFLMDGVQSANQIGVVHIGNEQLFHVAFREPSADWQLWLTGPDQVLPRRMAIIYKNVEGQPRVNIEFRDWHLNAQIPNSAFTFVKPEGAVQANLSAVRPRGAQQGGGAR